MALAERFRDLISGPTEGDPNSMSLRIGEAQQIYPEIWRHLDDARKAYLARGLDVSGYDQVRQYEQGVLGVTNMDLVTVGYGRNEHQIRVAEFNIAGYERARHAAGALMRAAPEVDWDRLQREENEQLAEIGSVTSNGKWWALGIAIALLVGMFWFLVRSK